MPWTGENNNNSLTKRMIMFYWAHLITSEHRSHHTTGRNGEHLTTSGNQVYLTRVWIEHILQRAGIEHTLQRSGIEHTSQRVGMELILQRVEIEHIDKGYEWNSQICLRNEHVDCNAIQCRDHYGFSMEGNMLKASFYCKHSNTL